MKPILKIILISLLVLIGLELFPLLMAPISVAAVGLGVILALVAVALVICLIAAMVTSPVWVPVAVVVLLCRRSPKAA